MHDRSLLGAADVSDDELAAMVARSQGLERGADVEVLESCAAVAAYDLLALTTAGRYWVRGRARTHAGVQPFAFFVKVVQSWARSPYFAVIPPELREQALAQLPWQTEPLVYRSDLGERLPDGLGIPTAHAVIDLDDESAALWLEAVDTVPVVWDVELFSRAAFLLGRVAASEQLRSLAGICRKDSPVRGYAAGRVAHQVLPALFDEALWLHPLIASAFDDELRFDLRQAAGDLPAIVEELESLPLGTVHGDACPRNLLVQQGSSDFMLIDYGFWGPGPLGFDLGQLLIGEVQLGERPADCLSELEARCPAAYVEGLRSEGCQASPHAVQRAHALQMLLFSGLSAIPFEHLGKPPTAELHRIAGERAQAARFMLDLVAATA